MVDPHTLKFTTEFDAQTGTAVEITDGIARVTAPNSSPYTFTGTNSFLIGTGDAIAVMDPGPDSDDHFQALKDAIGVRQVAAILLTHTHKDHSALARRIGAHYSAPIWFGGQHRLSRPRRFLEINPIARSCDWGLVPDRVLSDGNKIAFGDIQLEIIATPGHCANHLAFAVTGSDYLFSGDHVMGWNSTLVAVPDGSMSAYFNSLDKLLKLPQNHYLPAHGGPISNAKTYTARLRAHRQSRNTQISSCLENAPRSVGELRDIIYPDLPLQNRRAALMTLQAHLEYLEEAGDVTTTGFPWQRRYRLSQN